MESSLQAVQSPRPLPAREEPLCIRDAIFILYRLLDVAEEIDLDRAQELLAGMATRLKLSRERSRYIEIPSAPLTILLGSRRLELENGESFLATAHARLFGFGVLSIRYELALPGEARSDRIAALSHAFDESEVVGREARAEAARLCERLAPALEKARTWDGMETYTILFGREIAGVEPPSGAAGDERIARILLSEEPEEKLSEDEVRETTRHRFSYSARDLCVLDWNAAMVVEPEGSRDIPDILEFATAQLLEFRFYDALYDREIRRLYEILERPRGPFAWWFSGTYRRLIHQVNQRLIDTIEFAERVENSLKVIADSYLARVYQAALECFRVPAWVAGVNRKQDLTRQAAEVLYNESQVYTSHLLEGIVILLILYEIIAALV